MSHADYLTSDQLYRALNMRDLTDPDQGRHAIQALLQSVGTDAKKGDSVSVMLRGQLAL